MGAIWEIIKGIADGVIEDNNKDNNDTSKDNYDKELDSYNLEDWQKERVKKGLNNPWDFEEDDLEEGDYYDGDDD